MYVMHVALAGCLGPPPIRHGLTQDTGGALAYVLGAAEAQAYRKIVETCGFSRRKVLDRMIAAQAITAGATLVTRNGDDFRDIPNLILLEW